MKALQRETSQRFYSAQEFADTLDSFLRGELERERLSQIATKSLIKARREAERFRGLFNKKRELRREINELRSKVKHGFTQSKSILWQKEEFLDNILSPLEESFSSAITSYREVLNSLQRHEEAIREISKLLFLRYEEAESLGERAWVTYFEERLRAYGDPEILQQLSGLCSLTFRGLPPQTEIEVYSFTAQRYRTISQKRLTVVTPLQHPLELSRGTYLLKVKHPMSVEVRVPISLTRVKEYEVSISLPYKGRIPKGFTFIKDRLAMQTYPVTVAEYFDFLNDLAPEIAARRAPRYYHTAYALPNEAGRYVVPFSDVEGDEWQADWPIMLISQPDASAYAEWIGQQLRHKTRLPTADEWRNAAQGSDQRPYPWGLAFDASLCSMRESHSGRPTPSAVGAFPMDCSPYGVYDLSGTIAQWTSSTIEGDPEYYRVMGAAFNSMEVLCDLNQEIRALGENGMIHIGFRVVLDLTKEDLISLD